MKRKCDFVILKFLFSRWSSRVSRFSVFKMVLSCFKMDFSCFYFLWFCQIFLANVDGVSGPFLVQLYRGAGTVSYRLVPSFSLILEHGAGAPWPDGPSNSLHLTNTVCTATSAWWCTLGRDAKDRGLERRRTSEVK